VDSPADIAKISQAAGLDYATIKSFNPELQRWCTPPTTDRYPVALPTLARDRFLTEYNHPAFEREVRFQRYRVRSGDTLGRIARRFGLHAEPIMELNSIRGARALPIGRTILLPIPQVVDGATLAMIPARAGRRIARVVPISLEDRRAARTRLRAGGI